MVRMLISAVVRAPKGYNRISSSFIIYVINCCLKARSESPVTKTKMTGSISNGVSRNKLR